MSDYSVTLSTTQPNNYVGLIKLRQGDVASQSIQATITANGQLFNFDHLAVFFNAVLPNGNVVRDKVTEVDYVNSKLNYIVADSFLQEVAQVTAWFSFENDEKIIDSTKNFQYSVIGGWKECIPQGNYIYELSEIQREIEEIISNKDFTSLISKISSLETDVKYLDLKDADLQSQINTNKTSIAITGSRIDNLIANAGNGTVPSELIDMRVGADDLTYPTAGEAIRSLFRGTISGLIELAELETDKVYRVNVFDKTKAQRNKAVIGINNFIDKKSIFSETLSDANNYITTNIFKALTGSVVRCTTNGYNENLVLANRNGLIKAVVKADLKNGYTITQPDIAFARIIVTYNDSQSWTTYQTIIDNLMVTVNTELPTNYVAFSQLSAPNLRLRYEQIIDPPQILTDGSSQEVELNPQWSGRICATLGSSLTQMGKWDVIVKKVLGFAKMYNRGSGQTTMADMRKYNTNGYPAQRKILSNIDNYSEENSTVFSDSGTITIDAWYSSEARINLLPQNADLVLIDLATNDAYRAINNPTLVDFDEFMKPHVFSGDIWSADSFDDTTFEGAFFTMVKRIQTHCPNARIVVWGMLINSLFTDKNDSLKKYMTMYSRIEELCRKCGIIFIDTMMHEGANKFNILDYHTDYVHPATTDLAVSAVAGTLIGHLKNIYPKNYKFI